MILLGGLLILISWQNMQEVTLKFIAWERPFPLVLLIYLTFFGGFLFGLLYSKISLAFTKFKEKRQEKLKQTDTAPERSGFMKFKGKRQEKHKEKNNGE